MILTTRGSRNLFISSFDLTEVQPSSAPPAPPIDGTRPGDAAKIKFYANNKD